MTTTATKAVHHLVTLRVNGVLHLARFLIIVVGVLRPCLSVQRHRLHLVHLQVPLDLAAARDESKLRAVSNDMEKKGKNNSKMGTNMGFSTRKLSGIYSY